MKLKSIQIAGFKSFANKTNIDFQNGFTGIVGPNGSGKSNIIEAVRWALGEQSAKSLRGKKMKDIIFSGSKDQQPLNRAEVSLIFDNTDHFLDLEYTEVKVTRTYYRNGESIYSINDHECLMRDIHNLFMDTGLGEGSLSIISQGNVDDILADDVQKRRAIIETAAGVYRYKKQKNESEKKLEDTQINLNRISDIINEIKKQMGPLKEQSEIASLYLSKRKSLNELKFNQFNRILENDTKTRKDLQSQFKATQTEHQNLLKKSKELNQRKEQLAQTNNQLDEQKEQFQDELLKNSKLLESLSSEKKLNEQRKKFDLQKQAELNQQLVDLDKRQALLKEQLASETNNQNQLNQQLTVLENKFKALKVAKFKQEIQVTEQKLEKTRSEYVELMQTISETRNNLRMTEKLNQQADSNSKLLFQELTQKQKQLNISNQLINEINLKITQLESENEAIAKKIQSNDELIKTDELSVEKMRNHWLEAMRIFQEAKTERDSLASVLENHNNLYRGTRSLLKHKEDLSGIIGTVGDYLTVDKLYIKAIETALGGAIQQLMVETVADARKAINYLSHNKLGRVTLIPINGITERFVPTNVLKAAQQVDGLIGIAADLVQINPKYQRVKQHLLGGILVADSLKSATQISKLTNHRVKVVSLAGDVVNAGGSITGGKNLRQNDGLLTQKNHLKVLNEQVQRMQQKLELGEQNVKESQLKLKEDQENKRLIYQTASDLNSKLMLEKNNLKLQSSEKIKLDRQVKALNLKLGNNSNDDLQQPDSLKQQIDELQKQISENQQQNQALLSELENLKRSYNQETNSQNNLQEQIGIIKERFNNTNQHFLNLKRQIKVNDEQKIAINQEIKKIIDQLAIIKKISQDDTPTIEKRITEIENQIKQTKQTREIKRTELKQLDVKIDQVQKLLIKNSESLHQFESKLTVITQQLSQTDSKLTELSKQQQQFQQLPLSLDQLNRKIDEVHEQISELGHVNLGSIEAYQEIKQRYEFMQHQMEDLIEAKNQLLNVMNKMDVTVKSRFENTYTQIAQSFSKVFRNIFGGGEAKLELSDPHHLLTTGIDILVKPPGKRYRNISLLSGGEKALTALALLFAIIEVKPVPFVILDEAESALDPANVDRFARYIESLKDNTQFIVVTHRKETMIYADNLFGITMQDSGVSKLVSVDLSNKKNRR
ncbi:chromosome segregation protein SMC [Fructilactobacillus frigidiflavus]|uniref:chromosome segregation protein SMC n=1 Tax=Fructilactobacillus frigidiflavus TaxID=3242688 RepID=UPI003757345A